jgi:RNA polymerase sigma-70 factor (ECF subfamily)
MKDFRGKLSAAQGGDEEAFAAIWRHFQPSLLRYLKVKDSGLADDLAADTWLKVLGALPAFEGGEAGFRAWLFTIARNRRTDWYRGAATKLVLVETTQLALLPDANDVEVDAEEDLATDEILQLIAELPTDQAEAVALRIVAGLDVATVATIMRRSSGSVRVLCHRGLRALERKLDRAALEPAEAEVDADVDAMTTLTTPAEVAAAADEPGWQPEAILHG